jgi:hypothetical protein
MKACNRCKEVKPFSEYNVNASVKGGLSRTCKECDQKYQEARRRKSPEKTLEYGRKYKAKKREDFDFRLKALLNASKQRAALKGREHSITLDDLKELYPEDGRCPVFGIELKFGNQGFRECSPSIDRIDSDGGYTKENIQIISWKANRLKAYATVEELETLVAYLKQGD